MFAVVIDKPKLQSRAVDGDPRVRAWEFLIQRLERFTTESQTFVRVFHDEGEARLVRQLVRKARRLGSAGSMFGGGRLARPAVRLIEDPSPRKSHESYFIQLADLVAYAAFRRVYPVEQPRRVEVVPAATWDEIGAARLVQVSRQGPHTGIVLWPQ